MQLKTVCGSEAEEHAEGPKKGQKNKAWESGGSLYPGDRKSDHWEFSYMASLRLHKVCPERKVGV